MALSVSGSDGSKIDLDVVDFVWGAPALAARKGDYRGGQVEVGSGGQVEVGSGRWASSCIHCNREE